MYEDFAEIYDTLMDDYDYDAWADHYADLLRLDSGKLPERAAECACGTGSLTVRLAKKGIRMTGIDLSASMLKKAEEKARQWGVFADFAKQDMKELRVTGRTDAVLATCDGVNYLTRQEDVLSFFSAAYAALKPGGALCFDCSSRYKLETKMGTSFFGEERDGLTTLWKNTWNENTRVLKMDVTFFIREEDGRYRRIREEHHQRAHEESEIKAWLAKAGFEKIRAFGNMEMRPPLAEDERIHYLAVKPAEQKKQFHLI